MEKETGPTLEEYKTLQENLRRLERRLERLELRYFGLPQEVACIKTDNDLRSAQRVLGDINIIADYGVSKVSTYWLLSINHVHAEILAEAGIPMYKPPIEGEEPNDRIDYAVLIEELKEIHRRRYEGMHELCFNDSNH